MQQQRRPCTATYRVQLNAAFTFDDLAGIAGYLADLGISHVYLSPITQAALGSTHGYDVTDPTRISSDLGGAEAYERASSALERLGIGQVVDIVPNHMAAHADNPWWWDVLRLGVDSAYASYFDLRWQPPAAEPDGERGLSSSGTRPYIRLPVLEAPLDAVLREGKLRLEAHDGAAILCLGDTPFPLAPDTEPRGPEIEALNADPGAVSRLLERQHYRLVPWRDAAHAIDYRRFFDINGLVGLRVEDEAVFEASHRLILDLVSRGRIDGLRIDHIDGLRDPAGYLRRLRLAAPRARIVVEKILLGDEQLPRGWPIDGSTGYDFLNRLNGLCVAPAAEAPLTALYTELTGEQRDYDTVLAEKKRLVLTHLFGGDIAYLTALFEDACPDATWPREQIEAALGETIAALPVYRTYAVPERNELSALDQRLIETALTRAREQRPDIAADLFAALHGTLLPPAASARHGTSARRGEDTKPPPQKRGEDRGRRLLPALQQLSGAVMAKGAEDTAFYCYNRLASLNEVGGEPARFGVAPAAFHEACLRNAGHWPQTMLTASTHDTKRGEDTRLRIDALSELPREWAALVRRWLHGHAAYLTDGMPDANTRYLLYQTLAGAWPLDEARANAYMLKAAREAKQHTSWLGHDPVYEAALRDFVARLLQDRAFNDECGRFVARLDAIARVSSLSQTLLRLTAPGIPDFYQGSELQDLSLVDPDNRRSVDYEHRRRLLAAAKRLSAAEALQHADPSMAKLWLIWKTLSLRRARADLFRAERSKGAYQPLAARGELAECVIAFRRTEDLAVVAPRLVPRGEQGWVGTALRLPAGAWRDELTGVTYGGGDLALARLVGVFPVALLVRQVA